MPVTYSGVDIGVSVSGAAAPEPTGAVLFVAGAPVIITARKAGKAKYAVSSRQ
jgi:hypothetical protein